MKTVRTVPLTVEETDAPEGVVLEVEGFVGDVGGSVGAVGGGDGQVLAAIASHTDTSVKYLSAHDCSSFSVDLNALSSVFHWGVFMYFSSTQVRT